jgi:signal transduction histidine kinase
MNRCFGVSTSHPTTAAATRLPVDEVSDGLVEGHRHAGRCFPERQGRGSAFAATADQGEGLLHDARNLIGTIGLYCDLLSLPGVLKPEHRQYSDELRHLGERSGTLIDGMMQFLLASESGGRACAAGSANSSDAKFHGCGGASGGPAGDSRGPARPVSLRAILERRSGLLQRVANGSALEFNFGPAAATPVRVAEEAVERILVNLVRNAAAAQRGCESDAAAAAGAGNETMRGKQSASRNRSGIEPAGKSSAGRPGLIRITLGLLSNRVGEPRPWPFQQVRLSVEDAGCGMADKQVRSLLHGSLEPRGRRHGIGFYVVRDLVAATHGEIQVKSAPGAGTRVQIEWPVAVASATDWAFAAEPRVRSRRVEDVQLASGMEGTC